MDADQINLIKKLYANDSDDVIKIYRETFPARLPPPYDLDQITDYEEQMKIKFPEQLVSYLTNVSGQFRKSCYPCTFEFDLDATYIADFSPIPFGENISAAVDEEWPYNGMAEIGNDGCSFSDWIMVTGNEPGTVWSSDGDRVYRRNKNLFEYLTSLV